MDINHLKKNYGKKVALVGNIELDKLSRGTEDEIVQEVKDRMRDIAPGGGYLCSSSSGLADYCRKENVLAMTSAIRQYGSYPKQTPT